MHSAYIPTTLPARRSASTWTSRAERSPRPSCASAARRVWSRISKPPSIHPTRRSTKRVALPVDFSVSFVAFGVPLSVVVNQWVVIKTAFSAKGGSIKATGEYNFTAGPGFGSENGSWSATAPTQLTVNPSMVASLDGISLGATGIVLAYQARFLVGLGAFGFSAGVYFGLTAESMWRVGLNGVSVPGRSPAPARRTTVSSSRCTSSSPRTSRSPRCVQGHGLPATVAGRTGVAPGGQRCASCRCGAGRRRHRRRRR